MARGIHHVTAICGDAQRNVDFYAGVLGLRLVKRTVNFDDPETYHLYYGDGVGRPGSLITFFPWPGAPRGRVGPGQVAVTSFSVASDALGFWIERLLQYGVKYDGPRIRRGVAGSEQVLSFADGDGLMLEIVATQAVNDRVGWDGAPGILADVAIRGLHGVTLWEEDGAATASVLVDLLGFELIGEVGTTQLFGAGEPRSQSIAAVRTIGGFAPGHIAVGTVHHVAWRTRDDGTQLALRERLMAAGLEPTPVIDRNYFHSVYFREPGGVLFEIATDPPGFAIDESALHLGERLTLPPQFESHRSEIEAVLPPLHLPVSGVAPTLFADRSGPEDVSGDALGFIHRYIPPTFGAELASTTTLLLLHGTGADEGDLIPLGRSLLPGARMLSPRGKVDEEGRPRFFRRLAEGVFDVDDLVIRTEELARFVEGAITTYALDPLAIVAVGFSNGANIATSLLLRRPGLLRGAVLLSPMLPYDPDTRPDLTSTSVFIGAGRADRIAPPEQADRVADLLRRCGADVTVHWHSAGHIVTDAELAAARHWLETHALRPSANPVVP